MIKTLEDNVPALDQKLQDFTTKCLNILPTPLLQSSGSSSSTFNSGIIYQISPEDFLSYLQKSYGVSVNLQNPQNPVDIALTNIFSAAWQQRYGAPFNSNGVLSEINLSNFYIYFRIDISSRKS